MSDEHKENMVSNGNAHPVDHDEYQYINLIKNIIANGLYFDLKKSYNMGCEDQLFFWM